MTTRNFLIAGLVVALLLGGVASFYASSHPDGLEYVAEKVGFLDSADDHAAADGPMADYAVKGVDSPRLAGGLAGVIGILVTLAHRRWPRARRTPSRTTGLGPHVMGRA